ncbi:WGR domain-containing protein [Ruegeria halocynthiae]|uniref:WGR domain-containing protein n=1 Tax=Ruegeria halocynthiae TaxID=985054 RepID=UPI00068C37CC|nr:WGR domain-containing protein [Ruegeria halocynthiae]
MEYLINLAQGSCSVTLYHDDAALNKARFYRLDLSTNLWGEQIVERHWGRRGTWGQYRLATFGDQASAVKEMLKTLQAKLARGYSLADDTGICDVGYVDQMQRSITKGC